MARLGTWTPKLAWLALGALVLILAWALGGVAWDDIVEVLARLGWQQVVLWLAVNALITLALSARWWFIARLQGLDAPYGALALYRLAGFAVSYFTPGTQFGGEPLQVYLLHRRQPASPLAVTTASVTLDKLLEVLANFAFLVAGVAAIGLGGLPFRLPLAVVLPVIGGLLALLLVYTGLLWTGRGGLGRLVRFFPADEGRVHLTKLRQFFHLLAESEQQISLFCQRRPVMVLVASSISVLLWAAFIFEYRLILDFLGADLSWFQAISLLALARLSFLFPLPGGLGVMEAGQIFALQSLGFPVALAASLTVLIRFRDVSLGIAGLLLGGWLVRRAAVNPAAASG